MVEEKLTLHYKEWKVMHGPADEEKSAKTVVKLDGGW